MGREDTARRREGSLSTGVSMSGIDTSAAQKARGKGGNVEVHLSEAEVATLCAGAFRLGATLALRALGRSDLEG